MSHEKVTDILALQPHYVCRCACLACRHRFMSVVPVGTDLTRLECGACGEMEAIGLIVQPEDQGKAN